MEWSNITVVVPLLAIAGGLVGGVAFMGLIGLAQGGGWLPAIVLVAAGSVAATAFTVAVHKNSEVSESNATLLLNSLETKYGDLSLIPNVFPGANVVTEPRYVIQQGNTTYTCKLAVGASPSDVSALCETNDTFLDLGEIQGNR